MPDVMSAKELAEYLQVSRVTIYRNVKTIPGKKIGRCWRFFRPLVDKMIEEKNHRLEWKPFKSRILTDAVAHGV